jgi:hypothetical protein
MELSGIISQDSRKEEKWSEHSSPDLLSIVYQAKKFNKMMTLGRMGGARCNYRPISSKSNPYL